MSAAESQLVATSHCQLCRAPGSVTARALAGADVGQGGWGAERCSRGAGQPSTQQPCVLCSWLTRVQILLHKSCPSGNAHRSHQLHGSEVLYNPLLAFSSRAQISAPYPGAEGSVPVPWAVLTNRNGMRTWHPVPQWGQHCLPGLLLLLPCWLHQAAHHGQIKH